VPIYKILLPAEWSAFEAAGVFEGSPLDRGDGYIHLSTAAQVANTAARFFAGAGPLVVCTVEESGLGADLRWEPSPVNGDDYPHLYAPLTLTSVTAVRRFAAAAEVCP
jgi:uncharacterized protein (DUF952 family)